MRVDVRRLFSTYIYADSERKLSRNQLRIKRKRVTQKIIKGK